MRPSVARRLISSLGLLCALLGFAPAAKAADVPILMLNPTWGVRGNFMLPGIGLEMNLHIPHILNVAGSALYGIQLEKPEEGEGGRAVTWFESYAGFPIDWTGYMKGNQDVSSTTYREVEVRTAKSLVIEGGIMSGSRVFSEVPDNTIGSRGHRSRHRLFYPAAGLRYLRAWDDGPNQGRNVLWVHVLGPVLGLPEAAPGTALFLGDGGKAEDAAAGPEDRRSVGFKAGMSFPFWTNMRATMDLELGYLPAGGKWYFCFGNTIPISWI